MWREVHLAPRRTRSAWKVSAAIDFREVYERLGKDSGDFGGWKMRNDSDRLGRGARKPFPSPLWYARRSGMDGPARERQRLPRSLASEEPPQCLADPGLLPRSGSLVPEALSLVVVTDDFNILWIAQLRPYAARELARGLAGSRSQPSPV